MEEKIKEWVILDYRLKNLKKDELKLRKEICELALDGKTKGSKNCTYGQYPITATAKLNSKLDEILLKDMWSNLNEAEKACIKFVPKLVDKEYKNLDEKSNLHRAVENKPGTPSLKLKELKED